jgi:hypothetical protein
MLQRIKCMLGWHRWIDDTPGFVRYCHCGAAQVKDGWFWRNL